MSTPPVVELKSHPSPHPFVRRGLIVRAPRLPNGGVVTLRSPEGVILGDAFWSVHSDIAARRMTSGDVRFDSAALTALVERAIALRERVPGLMGCDGLRVIHAEGDGLSGLIVDRYRDVLMIELHSAGWIAWLNELIKLLHDRLGTSHHRVVLSERTARLEAVPAMDKSSEGCPTSLRIEEHGVRFGLDLAKGHKTGFFCDQRDNRRELARWVDGKDVLDLCTYTGGFAVTASVLGDPASVTAVDLDENALEVAKANANLNQKRVRFVHADAFDWLRQTAGTGKTFDVVVLDPPKFIATRREMETGRGKYHDLNRLALSVVAPGGLIMTSSCSGLLTREEHRGLVTTAARKEGKTARVLAATGAAPDHPVLLECPETEYLKCLWMIA
ncbi:MAG: class I SAM-dependent rRNA methyltransferase [Planctomycetota bacterium]